jgi:hypothetical protein
MAYKLDRIVVSDTAHDVHWLFNGTTHTIQYGCQQHTFTGPDADLEAARDYGICLRHALECAGAFDI